MLAIGRAVEGQALASLSTKSRGDAADYIATARDVLQRLVTTPGLIDLPALQRKPGGYARTLLFGDEALSLWAIVWDAGAATSVHDHHCSCCFALLDGALREVRFRPVGHDAALMTAQAIRRPGFVTCLLPSGPNLHQMINDGPREAISLHIYGFDHRQAASSVHREYEVVTQ